MSDSTSNTAKRRPRPLSPHLTVYKPQISSVLSILHRATGVFLLLGAFVFVWWLFQLANPLGCNCVLTFFQSILGKLFLLGWTFAIFYHLANGVRHLFWDFGYGFSLPAMTKSGWAVVLFAFGATFLAWLLTADYWWKG